MICTFLDLLGFSNYTKENIEDALNLINNYHTILNTNYTMFNKFTSLKTFLPCSDSIFIVAEDINLFIPQLSDFLIDCFIYTSHAYRYPKDIKEPTKVTMRDVEYNEKNKTAEIKNREMNWFPTIFRGGVAYGEIIEFKQDSIVNGSLTKQNNLAGKAIVKSVLLEKSGRGPRIFCDQDIFDKLDSKIYNKYILRTKKTTEILWPISIYNETDNPDIELQNNFLSLFDPAYNLWKSLNDNSIKIIYYNLMKIIVLSTVRFFSLNNYENECHAFIVKELKMKNIYNLYKDLVNGSEME